MKTHLIRPLQNSDLSQVRSFTDQEIGEGYYSQKELEDIFARSEKNGVMCSFVLIDQDNRIRGVRITYPPGKWNKGKGQGLTTQKWPHSLEETAYFQSLFISPNLQGQGVGGQLSSRSIEALKHVLAKGVVCHSWKESPNNSSTRYLTKMGFEVVSEHPKYWKNVDYNCTRCLKPPCQCTAQEMYLDLVK